jgi:hypothetical protein
MLLRPPFCVYNPVLGRASQFVTSIPQPAFSQLVNSIPQPAFSQLPGLGQALPRHPSTDRGMCLLLRLILRLIPRLILGGRWT